MMETIRVLVGSTTTDNRGVTLDKTRNVEFEGELLMTYPARPTDTRGTIETLYRAADGRLIVHVEAWSRLQGKPRVFSLHEVTEADLTGSGRFAALGRAVENSRPLTLAEALTPLDRLEHSEPEPKTHIKRDSPHCEACGKPLPASASIYHAHGGGDPVYLCEECAGADD